MKINPTSLKQKSPTWLLSRLYISTIVLVSLLTVSGQALTQVSLLRQKRDARIVNVAGGQRTLSQEIAKLAYAFSAEQLANRQANENEQLDSSVNAMKSERVVLRRALEQFSAAHEGLQSGSS